MSGWRGEGSRTYNEKPNGSRYWYNADGIIVPLKGWIGKAFLFFKAVAWLFQKLKNHFLLLVGLYFLFVAFHVVLLACDGGLSVAEHSVQTVEPVQAVHQAVSHPVTYWDTNKKRIGKFLMEILL